MNNILREKSIDGYEIFRVKADNSWTYLGSKYNMRKYIDDLKNNIEETSQLNDIVVFGSGNAVWLENIDDIASNKNIIIVEPDYTIYKMLINKKYNIVKNTIKIINMKDDTFYGNLLSSINSSNIKIFVFGNYDFVYKEEFKRFIEKIHDATVDIMISENTSEAYSKKWLYNYVKNIPHILKANYINKYENIFENKPAIIISAGPSLDKNLKSLKGNEDKFVIISVGRALRALEKYDIKADFTAVIDATEKMYDVFKDNLKSNIPLLFNEQTNNKIVDQYAGDKIFFSTKEFVNSDENILECRPITLFQGGSVAHACIDFSRVLGCNPIIFIGQDLAYTDDKIHSDSSKAKFEDNISTVESKYYTKGVKEDKVRTSYDFKMFRERIEMMIKLYNNITFINSTEGGAHIEGTIEKDLVDVLDTYRDIIDKSILLKNYEIEVDNKLVLKKLKNIYDDINCIDTLCREAIKLNDSLLDMYFNSIGKYNKALKRLDKIDVLVKEKRNVANLFETIIEAINNDMKKTFSNEEKTNVITENIGKVSEKGRFFYEKLIEGITYGKPLIEGCINKLEEIQ